MVEQMMKNSFLFLSRNKTLTKIAKRYGTRFGASRFVAGERIEEAITVIKDLNNKEIKVTLDYLGEFVECEEEAVRMADECIQAIAAIGEAGVDSQISVKLTSLGLDISEELALGNMRNILHAGKRHGVFVTIDMEDHSRCQRTLDIFKELREEYDNVGTVLQAYLYRTEEDIEALKEYHPNLRLVKGAYKELEDVAFPLKQDVDENYKKIIGKHLLNGDFCAIATHDERIIQHTRRFVWEQNIPHDQFEFQMLYGIRPERQEEMIKEGYQVRVYVPYGTDWYGYFMRRLAERPANVAFVASNWCRK